MLYFLELGLNEKYFNFVKNGTKRVEIRLFKGKFRNLKCGDIIYFLKEPYRKEVVRVKVKKLLNYPSFNQLIENLNIESLADFSVSYEELIKDLNAFYSYEMQKKFGTVAICFDLIEEN